MFLLFSDKLYFGNYFDKGSFNSRVEASQVKNIQITVRLKKGIPKILFNNFYVTNPKTAIKYYRFFFCFIVNLKYTW